MSLAVYKAMPAEEMVKKEEKKELPRSAQVENLFLSGLHTRCIDRE